MASGSNGHDDGNKTQRHPRWTRQETLVLIEAKKIVEERGRRGRKSSLGSGPDNFEPKWNAVSSYCKGNGVERGPVQCRKRWSNLLSDFKRIHTWDSLVKDEGVNECYWTMRSDLRRERRLPGFFDREVYDVLDAKDFRTTHEYRLALVTINVEENNEDDEIVEDEENRDDLFCELEKDGQEEIEKKAGKEKVRTDDKNNGIPSPVPISANKRQPDPNFWQGSEFQEGVKRRRQSSTDCRNTNANEAFIEALEGNANLLNAHIEEQKKSFQLDREQKKEQHDSLMAALRKITDTLEKIANKL